MRRRLDVALVRRGIVSSRSEAARMIDARHVTVSGAVADKASRLVGDDEPIEVLVARRWVGRGAEKLDHVLSSLPIEVGGRSVVDAGSSTGGFTQCLLEHGARRVLAVDVGTNQLHEKLLADARVVSREQTDIRDVGRDDMPFPCSLAVADLSFISLTTVVGHIAGLLSPEESHRVPEMILLVKPQFEVGRAHVSRGRGVITDPELHREAVERVTEALTGAGCEVLATVESPVLGAEGNREFLLYVRVTTQGTPSP